MTDEERKKLCKFLRLHAESKYHAAADEIERLEKELEEAKRHDMRDWYDALERGRRNPI